MMEEAQICERHGHSVRVASPNHLLVRHRTTRLGDILHAELGGVVYGIAEGEEGVRGDGHTTQLLEKGSLLLRRQGRRRAVEVLYPHCMLGFLHIALDIAHTSIDAVLPL